MTAGLSEDSSRTRLQRHIAGLRYWIPAVADAARIEEIETAELWRITSVPHTRGACPFELMLRADGKYDIVVAGETFEELETNVFDDFQSLVEAIAKGRVIQRRWLSTVTGTVSEVETIVSLPDGREWRHCRPAQAGRPACPRQQAEKRDRHFLPYQR